VSMKISRIWKRNGDENRMDFEVALDNLVSNCNEYKEKMNPQEKRDDIYQRLLDGEVVETPLAWFKI
jgi:hypothetical protein